MSVNTAHASHGVLIHAGECIILYCENVTMDFSGQDDPLFKGSKNGRLYLTTHRMIFNSTKDSEPMKSFSFPFVALNEVDIEQPAFGANYIKGKVRAQANGNWTGEAKFKLYFKSGGAIDFGRVMLRAAKMAQRNANSDAPPPYTPPSSQWYEAPPPAYQSPPQGYYGWVPSAPGFASQPPQNTVFMTDNPPPYPGIISGNNNSGYGYGGGPPGYSQPTFPQHDGYPQQGGAFPQHGGYPSQASYPPQGGFAPQGGFHPHHSQGGFQSPMQGGYPNYPGPQGFSGGNQNPTGGYPGYPGPTGQPTQGYGGFQGPTPGAMGFSAGPQPNSKEAEAAQSAYYDPNQPHAAYVPPPAYYEPPPSYNSLSNKKNE